MQIMRDKKLFTLGMLYLLRSSGNYIALPVLALFFSQRFSLIETSIIISVPTIFSMLFGFLGHLFFKRLGTKFSLLTSLALGIISYVGYLTIGDFYLLILSSLINGISRSIWEPVTKSLFALSSSGADAGFRIRYITICISGIVGPLICTFLTKFNEFAYQIIATIMVYAFISILVFWIIPTMKTSEINDSPKENPNEKFNFSNILSVLSNNFISIIIGETLVYMAFSQFESIFPLFLNEYFDNAVEIFSALLILNCVFSAVFQMLYMFISSKSKKRLSNKTIVLLGNIAFVIAYALFTYGKSSLYIYVIAICIYSIGEVLVIPATDVAVDEISPENQKSLYYGVAEIRSIGFTVGPILASAILQNGSPSNMCITTMVIFAVSTIFFFLNSQTSHPKRVSLTLKNQ